MLVDVRARVIKLCKRLLSLDEKAAAARTHEYLKFMKLKAANLDAGLAPSLEVDKVWHTHILDTQSYQQLQTVLLPGGGFIHHNPLLEEQPNYEVRYANTLSLLLKHFNETPNSRSWPINTDDYKKLQVVICSANGLEAAGVTGPSVYCYKKQTVGQLIECLQLLGVSLCTVVHGINRTDVPMSKQTVSCTAMWKEGIVWATVFKDGITLPEGEPTATERKIWTIDYTGQVKALHDALIMN
eukprot:11157-Heterococcus_DN1.PRE.1